MEYFDAYLMLAQMDEDDRARMPPGLRALAIRTPGAAERPSTGIVFFGKSSEAAFCRILEALWLDRRLVALASQERRLFLFEDGIYLETGGAGEIRQVGDSGPIRGAVEGFRGYLREQLERLQTVPPAAVPTPLGARRVRYLEVALPDPGGRPGD